MPALHYLQRLEAESIYIFREVVAECEKPVMLYSVGKDSSVMLHLARKAFAPARPPFPLLQIASGWDFREMLEFRDATAQKFGLELLVHTNEEGVRAGVKPWTHGAAYSDIMLTQALRQALDKHGFAGNCRRPTSTRRTRRRNARWRSCAPNCSSATRRPPRVWTKGSRTLTLHRLGVFRELGTSLKTTNALESIHARVESRVAKVDHWKNSEQKQRWLATAFLDLEPRLRRIRNFRALPLLREALRRQIEGLKKSAA